MRFISITLQIKLFQIFRKSLYKISISKVLILDVKKFRMNK